MERFIRRFKDIIKEDGGPARCEGAYDSPSSASVALTRYLSRGGIGRFDQCGSKTKLECLRPGSKAPLPAPFE